MFANDATGKGLLTKMHKQLKQQKYQENNPIQQKGEKTQQTFFQRRQYREGVQCDYLMHEYVAK